MVVEPLGKVISGGAGHAAQISKRDIFCHSIFFQALPSNLGMTWIGVKNLNTMTGEGVVACLLAPTPTYLPSFEVTIESLANGLNAGDWWIASDAPNVGAQVTLVTI